MKKTKIFFAKSRRISLLFVILLLAPDSSKGQTGTSFWMQPVKTGDSITNYGARQIINLGAREPEFREAILSSVKDALREASAEGENVPWDIDALEWEGAIYLSLIHI